MTTKVNRLKTFWERTKEVIEKIGDGIRGLRRICCFTSILASVSIVFFMGIDNIGSFLGGLVAICAIIGWVSAIIACPLKFLGNIVKLVGGGFMMGLCFVGIGCIIGLMIGIMLSFGMVFLVPAVVTIPYYFNELQYK